MDFSRSLSYGQVLKNHFRTKGEKGSSSKKSEDLRIYQVLADRLLSQDGRYTTARLPSTSVSRTLQLRKTTSQYRINLGARTLSDKLSRM